MSKFTILLALIAIIAIASARPQVNTADNNNPSGVNVVENGPSGGGVNVIDGEHQVNFSDGSQQTQPRSGSHSSTGNLKINGCDMGVYVAGFICALVLAGIVVAWIAYCMFIRERHKSEYYQYNISDLQHKNHLLSLNQDDVEKEITAGVLILPSRHRHIDEEYEKRPDYPESPTPVSPSTEKLIDVFNDGVEAYYKDGIYEVDSRAPYHSDV